VVGVSFWRPSRAQVSPARANLSRPRVNGLNSAARRRVARYYRGTFNLADPSFMLSARHRRTRDCPPPASLGRRLGRLGAALALAIQLLLPFMAMPQAAATPPATSAMAEATAVWGSAALCTLDAQTKPGGKPAQLAHHPCPICWTLQQAASLLPPTGAPELAPSKPAAILSLSPEIDAVLERLLSLAQPRGPPPSPIEAA
jgi:hypothetical protein